jgi:hypothetical protein
MGEEEYIYACSEFHKVIQTKLEEKRNAAKLEVILVD